MKFTALVREVTTRDIRVVITADSKGQAKRLLIGIADHPTRYKQGIVAHREKEVFARIESIEQLTPESIARIQKEMHK